MIDVLGWMVAVIAGAPLGYLFAKTRNREVSQVPSGPDPQMVETLRELRGLNENYLATTTTLAGRIKELGYALAEVRAKYQESLQRSQELETEAQYLRAELAKRTQTLNLNRETRAQRIIELEAELKALTQSHSEPPMEDVGNAPHTLPPKGHYDDLKQIRGIGPVFERLLNDQGVYTYKQIAQWQKEDIIRITTALPDVKGRIQRENWIEKAQRLHAKKYGQELAPRTTAKLDRH